MNFGVEKQEFSGGNMTSSEECFFFFFSFPYTQRKNHRVAGTEYIGSGREEGACGNAKRQLKGIIYK